MRSRRWRAGARRRTCDETLALALLFICRVMIQPLVVAGSVVKLAFSVALTYRTRWWWAPGVVTFAIGVALVAWSASTYGLAGVVLGTFALAVASVLRPASACTTQ
jgi:hypothetical protein